MKLITTESVSGMNNGDVGAAGNDIIILEPVLR